MGKSNPLDPYQLAVVRFRHGYAVVMAAWGSGKTTTVVGRIRSLLADGVRPERILSSTFTKEGAKEMAARLDLKSEHKLFTTFHSWALKFIRHEFESLPYPVRPNPLCLPLDAARTIAKLSKQWDVEWKDASNFISLMKRRGIDPDRAANEAKTDKEDCYATIYRKYEQELRSKGLLDFDSIVIETANLLEKRHDVAARWQYEYVQVDEAQDTDAVQWRIIKAISKEHGNLLAVGDENQGMYSWRGSESYLQSYFLGLFPGAKVFPLPINYRSTGALVEYCKKIAPIKNETVALLSTPNERGVDPTFKLYLREDEEAKQIVTGVTDLGGTAILARTNRQLAAFENVCGEMGLRYKLLGKSGFWGQREVKDAVAVVGSIVCPTDSNILRTLQARCEATKFIRKTGNRERPSTIDQLKRYQELNFGTTPLNQVLSHFNCDDSMQAQYVRGVGNAIRVLRVETAQLNGRAAMQAIDRYFGLLSAYDEVSDDEDDKKNFDNEPGKNLLTLFDYANRYASLRLFYDFTERVRRAHLARTNCLTLSTIHQAKGKEWPNVFVAGVNDEVLPHIKGDLEEEKRIYLVACSRAAKKLQVSANGVASELIKADVKSGTADKWENWTLGG